MTGRVAKSWNSQRRMASFVQRKKDFVRGDASGVRFEEFETAVRAGFNNLKSWKMSPICSLTPERRAMQQVPAIYALHTSNRAKRQSTKAASRVMYCLSRHHHRPRPHHPHSPHPPHLQPLYL